MGPDSIVVVGQGSECSWEKKNWISVQGVLLLHVYTRVRRLEILVCVVGSEDEDSEARRVWAKLIVWHGHYYHARSTTDENGGTGGVR